MPNKKKGNIGSAHVYVKENDHWKLHQKLPRDIDGMVGDQFGRSAAIHGNNIVVGGAPIMLKLAKDVLEQAMSTLEMGAIIGYLIQKQRSC